MAVTVFRAEECDLLDFLERPRPADEFAEDRLDSDLFERSLIRGEDVPEHFGFTGRGEHLATLLRLHLADLPGDARPLVREFENLEVELVDLDAQRLEVGSNLVRRGLCLAVVILARHGKRVQTAGCKAVWEQMYRRRLGVSTNRDQLEHNGRAKMTGSEACNGYRARAPIPYLTGGCFLTAKMTDAF